MNGLTRRCPAPSCGRPIPFHKFACATHWRQLTPATRRTVTATWEVDPGGPTHAAAKNAAIEELALHDVTRIQ